MLLISLSSHKQPLKQVCSQYQLHFSDEITETQKHLEMCLNSPSSSVTGYEPELLVLFPNIALFLRIMLYIVGMHYVASLFS